MIRGSTELVAIVGSPIAQVKSPENFNLWFEQQGQDRAMIAIDLQAERLDPFLATLQGWQNLRGCVVTVPYKQVLAERLENLTARARALGTVNVIRRNADGSLIGDNVDGVGFLSAARPHDFTPAGKRALVIGSGGVGSAIAYALAEGGVEQLVISDVSAERAEILAKRLAGLFPQLSIGSRYDSLEGFDLVVNASPVGMGHTGELPINQALLDSLQAHTLVADVVTSPEVTPLLAFAQSRGCRIQTGPEMALAQAGDLGAFMGVRA